MRDADNKGCITSQELTKVMHQLHHFFRLLPGEWNREEPVINSIHIRSCKTDPICLQMTDEEWIEVSKTCIDRSGNEFHSTLHLMKKLMAEINPDLQDLVQGLSERFRSYAAGAGLFSLKLVSRLVCVFARSQSASF